MPTEPSSRPKAMKWPRGEAEREQTSEEVGVTSCEGGGELHRNRCMYIYIYIYIYIGADFGGGGCHSL